MRLSPRIYAICEQVHTGETVADIGTDHGYVPMLLVKNNISPNAIMCDISADSLDKARFTFAECDIATDVSQFRVGDGLRPLKEAEVDTVIIAGLGGHTICEILDDDINKTRSYKRIIMQPRKHSGDLRFFLYTNGFDIVDESLVPEGKFICEIITAVPTNVNSRVELWPEDDIRWKYPEEYYKLNNDYVEKRLGWKIGSVDSELESLANSKQDRTELMKQLKSDREYLVDILEKNRRYNEEA